MDYFLRYPGIKQKKHIRKSFLHIFFCWIGLKTGTDLHISKYLIFFSIFITYILVPF